MTDPILGAGAIAKMTESAGDEAIKTTNKLLERALGPSFDVLGGFFAERMTEYVDQNRRRIAERALAKSPRPGLVHPRTAYKVIEQGSLADGPLMAEYFAGILAGSRSLDGRDDSGVTWTSILGSMSALQIRTHYLLYREWADLLHGRDLHLGNARTRGAHAFACEYDDIINKIDPDPSSADASVQHAVVGLLRLGLIGQYGWQNEHNQSSPEYEDLTFERSFWVSISVPGIELYGWAQGLSGLLARDFTRLAEPFDIDPPIERISTARLRSMVDVEERLRDTRRPLEPNIPVSDDEFRGSRTSK